MKSYQTNLASFEELARGLSPIQRAIFRELRDVYLRTGGPIQKADFDALGGDQNLDVRAVLNSKFRPSGERFACPEIDLETNREKAKSDQKKRAATARWNAKKQPKRRVLNSPRMQENSGSDADAMHTQCTRNASALHTHETSQPCGFAGDSALRGGDYRGGDLNNISKDLEGSFNNPPPNMSPKAEIAWAEKLGQLFGRKDGGLSPIETAVASQLAEPTESQLGTLVRYYRSSQPEGRDFRRRSMLSLLQHWPTELDRSAAWARSAKAREGAL